MRAVAGALVGLLLTAGLSMQLLGTAVLPLALVAPMGASAVLLFCVPASPLAQPWSVIGGNTVSALVGVVCARAIGNPLLAAPLAGALAILVMFLLRCLHPPSGAVALTTVLGGPAVHAAGFGFAFVPVCLNSALIVLVALVFNNLTGRRYPHTQQSMLQNVHATRDPVPTARVGFTKEDLDAALARYGQVLDISRDDLEAILLETEAQAYGRRFGIVTCGAIMSKDAVTVRPGMPLPTPGACCACTACMRCRCWTRRAAWSAWSARTISCTTRDWTITRPWPSGCARCSATCWAGAAAGRARWPRSCTATCRRWARTNRSPSWCR
jgi:CBS domain-containing membrane protein